MARHATLSWCQDLSQVTEHLEGLTDCPEDLYLIEGDPQSFDDSVFSVDELEKAVVVKSPIVSGVIHVFRKCRCLSCCA